MPWGGPAMSWWGVFGFPCSPTYSGSSSLPCSWPPVLVGYWEPLAVSHSAVVCLILPGSENSSWVTGGSPLSIVSCWCGPELRVLPTLSPPSPHPPKTAPGGAGVPLYPLLHMERGNSGGLEVSGNTRSCCGSLRDSVSPLLGAGGVQLTSATVMGTYTGHGHPCRRSKVFQQGRGARVMPALPCWHMDRLLSEAGVSQALGINRCAAGSSGADPGARRWGWRQVHWEKPARGRVGGNRFPQELGTNLAPWGGGKQPLAPLPAAPSGGNEAEAPNPSLQSVLCSQGSRCRSRHRDLGAMRDVLGGTLWDSPAWEQVLGQGVGLGWGWGAVFYC